MTRGIDQFRQKVFILPLVVAVVAVSLSGCTTLRRKFVRKSKKEAVKETEVPVLVPEEYAPRVYTPLELYRAQYSLFRAYFGDVWDALGRGEGDKRERYLLTQVASKIEAMAELLTEEKRAELRDLSGKVKESLTELDKAGAMRRYDLLRADLRRVETKIRRNFKPDMVESFFK